MSLAPLVMLDIVNSLSAISLAAGVSNFLPPKKDTTSPPLLLETPFSAHARHCLLHSVKVSAYEHFVHLSLCTLCPQQLCELVSFLDPQQEPYWERDYCVSMCVP